jgi:hypothetical protein
LATASASVRTGWPASYEILICFDRKSVLKFDRDAAGHGVMNTPNLAGRSPSGGVFIYGACLDPRVVCLGPLARAGGLPEFRIFTESETIRKPRRARFCSRAEFSSRHRQNAGGGFSLGRLRPPGPPDRCRCEESASTRYEPNPGSAYLAEMSFRADYPRESQKWIPIATGLTVVRDWIGADLRSPLRKSRELF